MAAETSGDDPDEELHGEEVPPAVPVELARRAASEVRRHAALVEPPQADDDLTVMTPVAAAPCPHRAVAPGDRACGNCVDGGGRRRWLDGVQRWLGAGLRHRVAQRRSRPVTFRRRLRRLLSRGPIVPPPSPAMAVVAAPPAPQLPAALSEPANPPQLAASSTAEVHEPEAHPADAPRPELSKPDVRQADAAAPSLAPLPVPPVPPPPKQAEAALALPVPPPVPPEADTPPPHAPSVAAAIAAPRPAVRSTELSAAC